MTPKEHAIAALIALCHREGGHTVVAAEADLDEQTLWQVVRGIKLPSGEPRGVGPLYQRKLSARYPDWLSLGDRSPATATLRWPIPRISPAVWGGLTERERGIIEQAAVEALRKVQAERDAAAALAPRPSRKRASAG